MIRFPKDDDVIAYILDVCAKEPNTIFSIGDLIDEYTGDVNKEMDISALCVRINQTIRRDDLAIINTYSIQANDKTIKIAREGGYLNYLTFKNNREKLREEADIARDKYAKKANRKSNIAIAISIIGMIIQVILMFV